MDPRGNASYFICYGKLFFFFFIDNRLTYYFFKSLQSFSSDQDETKMQRKKSEVMKIWNFLCDNVGSSVITCVQRRALIQLQGAPKADKS